MSTATDTLALVKAAQQKALSRDEIAKTAGWNQPSTATTGLNFYDLEAPAKTLYPVLTPLRNAIPRVTGKAGTQANWRAITGINTTGVHPGVSEGNRGALLTHTSTEYLAAYRGFGLEDRTTFEAEYASMGYDDARARMTQTLLQAFMIQEELQILGGNTSTLLGTTPTPTLAQVTDSTSTTTNSTLSVICVALGFRAYWALAGYNNGGVGSSLGLTVDPNGLTLTRTNAGPVSSTDVINGGTAQKSAAATVTIDATHKSCTATVTAVPGAFGYAWYWGTSGNEVLGAITTINSLVIAADASTAIAVGSNLGSDKSTSSLDMDGLIAQIIKSGSGAYVKALATGTPGTGTKLTSNGAGGIAELDTLFQDRYNLYRLSPNQLYASADVIKNMNTIIIANGGAPLIRFGMDGGGTLAAGVTVGSILNRITGDLVKVTVHPNLPPGTLLTHTTQLPYALSGVAEMVRILCRRDYYQIEWPMTRRSYDAGVYSDEVLQHYFPPALGLIYNIRDAA